MITYIRNIPSYSKYISDLKEVCKRKKINIDLIGYEEFKKADISYPIYKMTINPNAKIKFGICTGVHGNEIAGPLSLITLIDGGFDAISKDICYEIFPMINPTGFDLNQRYDDEGKDLNAIYKTTLASSNYNEIQILESQIKDRNYLFFLSSHEDVDEIRYYQYTYEETLKSMYKTMLENASSYTTVLREDVWMYKKQNSKFGIDSKNWMDFSIEWYVKTKGLAQYVMVTETPALINLNHRIKINIDNIAIISMKLLELSRQ